MSTRATPARSAMMHSPSARRAVDSPERLAYTHYPMTQDNSAASGPRAASPSGRWYVRAGLLIDGNGGPPLQDGVIAVEGSRIVAVGRAEDFGSAIESGSSGNFQGAVVMPGMVDCHAHATRPADS